MKSKGIDRKADMKRKGNKEENTWIARAGQKNRYEEQGQDRKADMNRQDRREEQKKLAIAGEKSRFEE